MASPFLPYAATYFLIEAAGVPAVTDGRLTPGTTTTHLVHAFLGRSSSASTTTGGRAISPLPGVPADAYLYRGWALRWATVTAPYDLSGAPAGASSWTALLPSSKPIWLAPGTECEILHGSEPVTTCRIETCTGRFGGAGIDTTISASTEGIPIVISSRTLLL